MTEGNNINKKLINIYNKTTEEKEDNLGRKYKNLSEEVYEIIKKKIICHEFKPGERVIDKHIAEELGVSRSLVRQAFNILEKQELLVQIPRTGFFVREITRKDVQEIYDIRKLLETEATRLAVPGIKEEDINYLEKIFNRAKEELKEGIVKNTIKADANLHDIIQNNCGNQRLAKMIKKYSNQYVFYRIIDLSHIKRAEKSYREHYRIFTAIKNKDVVKSTQLMSKHIENAKNIILTNFEDYTYS